MDVKHSYYYTTAGYKIVDKTDADIVTAGGGTKPYSEFWTTHNLNPANFVPSTRSITINGVTKDLSADRTFTTPDTVTRIKGGASGTLVSGDITLAAGANMFISQTGNVITLASTDTTYSAGNGLTLTGTTFTLPVTTNGTGNVITGLVQTATGITVYMGSVPTNADLANYIPNSQKGVPNGVATLDDNGLIPPTQLPSYVDDVIEAANLAAFPNPGEQGKIYVALDTNKTYRWSGSAYIYITSGAVDSVNGQTGVVNLTKANIGLGNVDNTADSVKNVQSATKWTTPRTIGIAGDASWEVTVDGSANVSANLVLASTGVAPGAYKNVTVDAKGRVTGGNNDIIAKSFTVTGNETLTHGFGTKNLKVFMIDSVTSYPAYTRYGMPTINTVNIEFDVLPTNPLVIIIEPAL